jgi:hypothetical protein
MQRSILDDEPVIKRARVFGNTTFCSQNNGTIMPAKETNGNDARQPIRNDRALGDGHDGVDTNLYSRQM